MKSILSLFLLSLLFQGCAISPKTFISYDMTNPVKIEESVKGLPIEDFVGKNITSKEDMIVIASIESKTDFWGYKLDFGTRYLIEDNLISSLKKAGYRLGERDPDLMWHLQRESKDNYNTFNFQYKGREGKQEEEAKAPEGATIHNYYYGDLDQSSNISKSGAKTKEEEGEETIFLDMTAADILLSYRVLECGVIYKNIPMDQINIERFARTRLNCRLIKAKTGEIINAGIVENEVSDIILKKDKKKLESMQYKFYDHTLPNIPILDNDVNDVNDFITAPKSKKGMGVGGVIVLFSLLYGIVFL